MGFKTLCTKHPKAYFQLRQLTTNDELKKATTEEYGWVLKTLLENPNSACALLKAGVTVHQLGQPHFIELLLRYSGAVIRLLEKNIPFEVIASMGETAVNSNTYATSSAAIRPQMNLMEILYSVDTICKMMDLNVALDAILSFKYRNYFFLYPEHFLGMLRKGVPYEDITSLRKFSGKHALDTDPDAISPYDAKKWTEHSLHANGRLIPQRVAFNLGAIKGAFSQARTPPPFDNSALHNLAEFLGNSGSILTKTCKAAHSTALERLAQERAQQIGQTPHINQ